MPACIVCDEVITQPLCPACLSRGVASWLQEIAPDRPELLLQLQDLTEESALPGATVCIRCNSQMGVCAACYTQELHNWLVRALPMHAPEFLALFSLDPVVDHFGEVAPSQVVRVGLAP